MADNILTQDRDLNDLDIAAKDIGGVVIPRNIITDPLGNDLTPLTDDQLRAAPVPVSGEVALDAATLAALETISTGGLTDAQLRADNVPVQISALLYPQSTLNNSTTNLAAGTSFTGGIETIQQLQAAQVQVYCDQPYRVVVNQYIDLAGTKLSASDTIVRAAGQPLSINVTLPGNYFNVVVTNLGIETTEVFELNTTFGIMDSGPRRLGRTVEGDSMPVTLSTEDADILNDMVQRLGVLSAARNSDGSLRVTLLGGTVATVTTVGTVTTVATLTNQTNIGGYTAAPNIPSMMNLVAQANINNMIG